MCQLVTFCNCRFLVYSKKSDKHEDKQMGRQIKCTLRTCSYTLIQNIFRLFYFKNFQTDRRNLTKRKKDRQKDRQTERKRDRQTDRKTDGWIVNRQTDDRQRDKGTIDTTTTTKARPTHHCTNWNTKIRVHKSYHRVATIGLGCSIRNWFIIVCVSKTRPLFSSYGFSRCVYYSRKIHDSYDVIKLLSHHDYYIIKVITNSNHNHHCYHIHHTVIPSPSTNT